MEGDKGAFLGLPPTPIPVALCQFLTDLLKMSSSQVSWLWFLKSHSLVDTTLRCLLCSPHAPTPTCQGGCSGASPLGELH